MKAIGYYQSLPIDNPDALQDPIRFKNLVRDAERSLREIEARVRVSREEKFLGEVSAVLNGVRIHNTWRSTAVLVYRNWLEHLCTRKRHADKLMFGVGV